MDIFYGIFLGLLKELTLTVTQLVLNFLFF